MSFKVPFPLFQTAAAAEHLAAALAARVADPGATLVLDCASALASPIAPKAVRTKANGGSLADCYGGKGG